MKLLLSLSLSLSCLVLTCQLQPCHGFWSYFSSSPTSKDEDDNESKKDTSIVIEEDLVSPIINREMEVSVVSHNWPSTHYNFYCEAWAYLQPQWSFLDALVTHKQQQQQHHQQQDSTSYQDALNDITTAVIASNIKTNVPLLKYAITMRSKSPTCELHRTLAMETLHQLQVLTPKQTSPQLLSFDAFAILYPVGHFFTTMDQFHSVPVTLSSHHDTTVATRDILLPGESLRTYNNNNNKNGNHGDNDQFVVLYGNIGTLDFQTLFQGLVQAAVPMVIRHFGAGKTIQTMQQGTTILQGYGARLDIRNVEYKVFDEKKDTITSKQKMVNISQVNELRSDVYLAGVNVSAIFQNTDNVDGDSNNDSLELQRTLWKRHEQQHLQSQRIPPTWQRRQLSMQAAYTIHQASISDKKEDALGLLEHLSQNLPSVASTLVHVTIPEEYSDTVDQINSLMHPSNQNQLWINGRSVPIQRPSFNVFELLQLFQTEQQEMQKLQDTLGPYFDNSIVALTDIQSAWIKSESFGSKDSNSDGEEGNQVDKSQPPGGLPPKSNAYRIDVGRGWKQAVIYVNDIEKDEQYQQYSTSVMQMLWSMQYGMPPAVRRNVYTILAVHDPINDALSIPAGATLAFQTMQSQYPVRLGMLFVNQDDIDSCKEWIRLSKPNNDEPCPVPPLFDGDNQKPTIQDFSQLAATAQMVHRIYRYVSDTYAGDDRAALTMYNEYFLQTLGQAKYRKGASMFSAHDLLLVHINLMQGLQMSNGGIDEAMKALTTPEDLHDNSSTNFLYGKSVRFAIDKGLKPGMSFLNGISLPQGTMEEVGEEVGSTFMEEQQHILTLVMGKEITDSSPRSIYGKLLSGDNVFKKVHPLLASEPTYIHLKQQSTPTESLSSLLFPTSLTATTTTTETADIVAVVEAVLDLSTKDGLQLAANFIKVMNDFPMKIGSSSNKSVSIGYRIIPTKSSGIFCGVMSQANTIGVAKLLEILQSAQSIDNFSIENLQLPQDIMDQIIAATNNDKNLCSIVNDNQESIPNSNFLVANGRVYSLQQEVVASIDAEDIELLLSMEVDRTKATTELANQYKSDIVNYHDAISQTCSFLAVASSSSKSGPERDSPESDVLAMDADLFQEENEKSPFRFTWNSEDINKSTKELQMQVFAIVDPVTETAQRLSTLLKIIRDQLKLPLTLYLTPQPILDGDSKIPISSYYRFVADPLALPDTNKAAPKAHFSNLPTNHVLTLRLDVPEPWDVQQTKSIQDTDNLRCDIETGCSDEDHETTEEEAAAAAISTSCVAAESKDGEENNNEGSCINNKNMEESEKRHVTKVEYGLNRLLFFGQCYQARGSPPNGLQLTLTRNVDLKLPSPSSLSSLPADSAQVEIGADGTTTNIEPSSSPTSGDDDDDERYSDTLVMKTVGYWQLPANPGVWNLNIDKNSRGSEIFDMVEGTVRRGSLQVIGPSANNATKRMVMKDFVNRGELLVVQRRKGYEKAKLFDDTGSKKQATNDSSDDEKEEEEEEDVINVFSLATGHLYERFLKIMMLSVTKRTSSKVKFWLFENFLSPTFKASAQAMAKRVGCEVEFVTYKWPEWLRGQREKQRIIWGYKILFLDVLFPLHVKKIIYVDADQVVRGDLKELWDMDLQGAPYGYTPFCTSRETTLGFQFWRSGFWENHLRGKPYHISALYVVDLETFRRTLVGDQLRSIYQQLSADPNSLANLDQDLPNFAQHQVPIFSLPQEWLWCETWCSDETKAASKTIDLCNNPLHKEPKVSMAKRIISGSLFNESWVELDAEVERYESEYLESLQ